MTFLSLGFFTGFSLILAIGAQNIFVIEQGLKRQFIFIVCLICSLSDLILIFIGIFLFEYFKYYFTNIVELILNILLLIFLIYFIISKLKFKYKETTFNTESYKSSLKIVILKTISFTYLNPHVYSDTVFFLGNFSKNYLINQKISFGIGASIASFLFFFVLGYLSNYLSKYAKSKNTWRVINIFIISFMSVLIIFIIKEMIK